MTKLDPKKILEEFLERRQAGESVGTRQLYADYPELASELRERYERWLPEQILQTFLQNMRAGESVATRELYADHPELASELRELYERWLSASGLLSNLNLDREDLDRLAASVVGDLDSIGAAASNSLLETLRGAHSADDRYEILDVIGSGGMGVVHRAWDRDLHRRVAMKIAKLHGEPGGREKISIGRFLDEARVTGQLDHPGVVPVHELGQDEEGHVFFTMRLVKGETLASVFQHVSRGTNGWNRTRALTVLAKVCDAVSFAHSKGVIHRDLKPANIMVGRFGQVYVMDWGLARVSGEDDRRDLRIRQTTGIHSIRHRDDSDSALVTMEGDVLGTPNYMSPEQARGEASVLDARSDAYAIGAILYELLTGSPPYAADGQRSAHETLERIREGPPLPPSQVADDVPAELEAISLRAMAYEPRHRYADVGELSEDLSAAVENRVVRAYQTGAWAEFRKWIRRNRATFVASMLSLASILAGLIATASIQAGKNRDLAEVIEQLQDTNAELDEGRQQLRLANEQAIAETERAEIASYATRIQAAQTAIDSGRIDLGRKHLEAAPPALRGWEWRWWASQLDRSIATLRAPGLDRATALCRMNQLLIVGYGDGRVLAWEPESRQVTGEFGPVGTTVFALDTLESDKLLLIGDRSGVVSAWRLGMKEPEWSLHAHAGGHLYDIATSHSGDRFATAATDGTVKLWSLPPDDGRQLLKVEGIEARAFSVDWDPTGQQLLTASNDSIVRLLDASTGAVLHEHELSSKRGIHAYKARFDHDGRRLAVGNDAGTLHILDPAVLKPRVESRAHASLLTDLSFSPSGTSLLSTSFDGTARVWDSDTGLLQYEALGHSAEVLDGLFLDSEHIFATCSYDGTVKLWDRHRKVLPHVIEIDSIPCEFDATGNRFVVTGRNGDTAVVRISEGGFTVVARRQFEAWGSAAAWKNDRIYLGLDNGTIEVWDERLSVRSDHFEAGGGKPISIDLDPTGQWLVAGTDRGKVSKWDTRTRQRIELLSTDGITTARFSPNGAIIALSYGGGIRILAANSHRIETEFDTHHGIIASMRYSPSGHLLATAGHDHRIRLWSTDDWSEVANCSGHTKPIEFVRFSPDGNRLVSGSQDFSLMFWAVPHGTSVATFPLHGWVQDAAFSPGGDSLVVSVASDTLIFDLGSR